MGDLKELIAQRGRLKMRITLFEKYLNPLSEHKLNKSQCNELNLRLHKFQDLSYTFEEVQNKIEALDTDVELQMEERENIENRFVSLTVRAQELSQLFESSSKPECVSASASGCAQDKTHNLKLPPLKIPPFTGDPSKWLEFRDTYLSLIHNNNSIDNINKFHYLQSYLEGTASAAIKSVSISSLNYPIAWSLLCDRYDNKRILMNEHIKGLFSIEPIYKESEKRLRDLIDTISKNLSALNSLGEPTDHWDSLIIYMASIKLDPGTAGKWEEFRSTKEEVKLSDFFKFLHQRATVLETINASKENNLGKRHSLIKSKSFPVSSSSSLDSPTYDNNNCMACKQDHKLYNCPKFQALSVDDRIAKVFEWHLCNNCLRSGHRSHQCRLGGCRICKKKHNSMLHKQSSLHYIQPQTKSSTLTQGNNNNTSLHASNIEIPNNLPSSSKPVNVNETSCDISMSSLSSKHTLLSTALVEVIFNNKNITLKALLDSGSQSSFLTQSASAKLGLPKGKNHHHWVSGLNNSIIKITEHCDITIKSISSSFSTSVKCYIIPLITDRIPQVDIDFRTLKIPNHIQLADPTFYLSSEIDLLLGADVFWDLLCTSRIKLGPQRPILQETHLGWVVAGPTGGKYCNSSEIKTYCNFSKEIQQQLSKFWEIEDLPIDNNSSSNENYCERLFSETTYRDQDGRFCVQIPFSDSPSVLGDSYNIAKKRFILIEKKLDKNQLLYTEYIKFMHEYEQLGHMSQVTNNNQGCFLPHHAVIRESSETTKVRVVYDASAKTSNNISLNDIQYVGPVIQDSLFAILLRFRQYKYVVTADVEKMYRQILIHPEQRKYQMILWRDNKDTPIKTFQLNTVTYGTASAPFLSTRCLLQLANECKDEKISEIIKHDFYIDDFITGSNSKQELLSIVNSVTSTLKSACLPLRKFRTNTPSIFHDNKNVHVETDLKLGLESSTLGLKWDPVIDVLKFPTKIKSTALTTKRIILSESSKLFDPLGLLSACTIIPKIILQNLWRLKLDWDDSIPSDISKCWINFVSNLHNLSDLKIPRYTFGDDYVTLEIHTFCDASSDAYAACVYVRSKDILGHITLNLLCAKTKVSPIKSLTIPKLELCGALLASRLASVVLKTLRLQKPPKTYFWTDSSVVLSWLSHHPRELKTFVANRIAKIQEMTSSGIWRHVPGIQNPADLASRGLNPKHIQNTTLWWHGPKFLLQDEESWPNNINKSNEVLEMRAHTLNSQQISTLISTSTLNSTFTTTTNNISTHAIKIMNIEKYSNLTLLHRSLAYVLRFINNTRHANSKHTDYLTTDELKLAFNVLLKQHQSECFEMEIKLLYNKKNLPSRSRLISLLPFLDEDGILRVGGRIQNSSENYCKKHPIILDCSHTFTKLLFLQEHKKLLHCGPLLLLTNLRQIYWPIAGRRLARSTVNNCKICRIMKASTLNPIMGNLPTSRVTPNLPFQISGVDFAGPFPIRDRLGRGCKIIKSYLCLFICLSTKAVHLELASDLSTDIFFLCLKRFISRRGKPSEIYCDNGRNFVGANNDLHQFLKSVKNNESISSFAANEGIKFRFSPAYSPHFGGLWEAGIKSAKHHLHRMLGKNNLTFEELSTLFVQIEAILNSRPLTPLSSDPSDLLPLTPGHFLIGKPLTSLPSPALLNMKTNRINRFLEIEQMKQHFWERWRNEFLCELQQRSKWRINQQNLRVGDMVVIKEPNLPPLKWSMGRIIKFYPGADGIARVADVLTARGIIRRAIHNLCPLPVLDEDSPRQPKVVEGGEDVRAQDSKMRI